MTVDGYYSVGLVKQALNNRISIMAIDLEALSPTREAAAYEALWEMTNASVKNISDKVFTKLIIQHSAMCKKHSDNYHLLSSLVENNKITTYYDALCDRMGNFKGKFGIKFIGDTDYPEKLLDAKYPSPLLYYSGNWDLIFSNSVSIVGTRKPTIEGIKRTKKLVKLLLEDNYTITSGLASGIDTAAHNSAIDNNGQTIAVIGTPIDHYYPKENKELQKAISDEHLVVSQVPFIKYDHQDYRKNRFFFPERNKTMSAISLATIIVEAGDTSGSLIQAKAALEQGRKLFILDSCFENTNLKWPNEYLKKGGIRVKDYSEIKDTLHKVRVSNDTQER